MIKGDKEIVIDIKEDGGEQEFKVTEFGKITLVDYTCSAYLMAQKAADAKRMNIKEILKEIEGMDKNTQAWREFAEASNND